MTMTVTGVAYVWVRFEDGGWSLQCELVPSDFYCTGYFNYGYKYFGMNAVSISDNVIAIGNMDNRRHNSSVYDGNLHLIV